LGRPDSLNQAVKGGVGSRSDGDLVEALALDVEGGGDPTGVTWTVIPSSSVTRRNDSGTSVFASPFTRRVVPREYVPPPDLRGPRSGSSSRRRSDDDALVFGPAETASIADALGRLWTSEETRCRLAADGLSRAACWATLDVPAAYKKLLAF